MLEGKKTYITAALAIVGALLAYFNGTVELSETIQVVVTAVLGATIRKGISTETKNI